MGALAVAALAGGSLMAGCHRHPSAAARPPKPSLGEVDVKDVAADDDSSRVAVDPVAVGAALRARLLATGLFAPEAGTTEPVPVVGVRVQVGAERVEVGAKGESRARVRVVAQSRPSDAPGAIAFEIEGQGAEPYVVAAKGKAGAPPPLDALVIRVGSDLIGGYAARVHLREAPESELHAALVSPDAGELREEAIRAAGERQLHDEAPALLKLLADPDEPTRDAALGALIALHDRRAVTELTRTRSLHDRHEMRKIIEAIAILGGQEAEDYLSFIAASHDDDDIRAAAAAARARLERHAGEPDSEAAN